MSAVVPTLQAIVRQELASTFSLALGIVTQSFTNEGGSGDSNLAVNLRLRGSALELQRVPVAVGRLGLSLAPRVGDLAVIGFVEGDVDGPVVLGFLYDEQVRPPDATPTEVVYEVPDDEASGTRRAELGLPNGNKLTVEDEVVTVTMGGTTMTIEADGAIKLEASGDIVLKAGGAVSIEASGAATVKGMSVAVEAQTEAKVKGATTSIAGMTSFSAS